MEHRNYKVVYRRYASLFFLVGVDGEEVIPFPHLICFESASTHGIMYAGLHNCFHTMVFVSVDKKSGKDFHTYK